MSFQKILVGLAPTPANQIVFEAALELAIANNAQLFLFHSISADSMIAPPCIWGWQAIMDNGEGRDSGRTLKPK